MSIEGNGVNLRVEPPFSSILVVCTDILVLLTTQCWSLNWALSYVSPIPCIFFL